MNALDKFLMTFINKNSVLIAENLNDISFRDFRNCRKMFNFSVSKHYQSVNIVMNNKSTQNTQENVVKYYFKEFSIFHAIY